MTGEEQNLYLNKEYAEAMRYMDNAKNTLAKAGEDEDGYYNKKIRCVRTACDVAYKGVEIAMDAWLKLHNVSLPLEERRGDDSYCLWKISQLDEGMSARFNSAYNILELYGYNADILKVSVIEDGFEVAYEIIDRIKPEHYHK